jgi:uncharacterized tellurite resistance protein B-like protein
MPWGKGIKVMRSVDFYSLFPEGAVTTKAKYAGLGRAFETIGIGIEPDLKFGGGLPSPNNLIALFRLSGAAPNRVASPSFDGAALLLQLAAAVASVDGTFGDQEAQLMLDHIKQGLELPEDEFQRLAARVEVYRSSPPHLTGLGKKVGALDPKTRVAIGDFLVQVVHADGIVHPSEVRSLEKIYGLLGLDVATLYSKLHVASSEPITVRPATEAGPSYQLPAPPQPPPPARADSGLKLDMAKVAALKADSARVSALLGSIFSEPPTDGITASMAPDNEADPQPSEEGKLLSSLDPDHRGLLHALLQRSQWTRSELEEMCADRSLMVDGAIERINEAAFEHYDQPIIEGDDPMDINCDLLVEETI